MLKNSEWAYGAVAKSLHAVVAVLVLVMLIGGFLLDDVPKVYKPLVVNVHKLVGLLILGLMIFRFLWRLNNQQPALPALIPTWQKWLAKAVHSFLYVAVILIPVSGWVMATAAQHAPHIGHWVLALPGIAANKAVSHLFFEYHEALAWLLIALLVLHVAAFIKHWFAKDGVATRMW